MDSYLYETACNLGGIRSKEEAAKKIRETLAEVGLNMEHVQGKFPNQFSGGELQRISIARALITSQS